MADIENKKKDVMKLALSKIVMHDAGVEHGKGMLDCPMPSTKDKTEKSYPTIYLDIKQAPVLAGAEVGNYCTLLIKAKVVGHSMDDQGDNKRNEYRLEIHEVGKVEKKENNDEY